MASFSIRKLDDNVYKKLKLRAAQHGVSMEEEVRQILTKVVDVPEKMSQVFQKHFGKTNGLDSELTQQRKPHEPIDFDE
jgi:plasmid stability protein